eukprot:Phypoly_transcript_16075.p1 GENE.Phypoly_transcript_16075~~Phypoly_transcript_16075.p1  ORF type:complete len:261 (+),score=37.30 Phypoly_transcript_16075:90-872(+)
MNKSVLELVQQLSSAVVYTDTGNFDTNKKLWNNYAQDWGKEVDWVKKMVDNLPDKRELEFVGDEWSDATSFHQVLEEFLFPLLSSEKIVAEVGSGGGRVASQVAGKVKELYCFDIAEKMLQKAKTALAECTNTTFHLIQSNEFPTNFQSSFFDVIYAFDVFPHVDLHSIWQWLRAMNVAIKPGGYVFISTANLAAPGGWTRFAQQTKYSAGGFYFLTPETLDVLVSHTDFVFVKRSSPSPTNIYYNRDFLCVLHKPNKPT